MTATTSATGSSAGTRGSAAGKFFVELIHPSRYDDDGYVIQWHKSWVPSNALACLYGLADDAARRRVLGPGVDIAVGVYDECNAVVPVGEIIRRLRNKRQKGLVCLVGVQTNQFPRAMDLARQFRSAGIDVAIGGFHVSGCMAMLPALPAELQEALDLGVSLFAGEAEGRMERVLRDAWEGKLQPVYNYLGDLPDLAGQPMPLLPQHALRRVNEAISSIDTGRGCPFRCTFCTIINVQGRQVRSRRPDDIEAFFRREVQRGIRKFFLTDDNFARNPQWEAILDRIIALHGQGLKFKLIAQVDSQAHRIPRFVKKMGEAGCRMIFIGMESLNPENLAAVNKGQNHVEDYRSMLQAWRDVRVITQVGYILGFPADTPESVERDIRVLREELPVDLVKFSCLTPLPGSEDHRRMVLQKQWIDADLNNFTGEKAVTHHGRMTDDEWRNLYSKSWELYYSPRHVEALLRRACNGGPSTNRLMTLLALDRLCFAHEKVQPFEGGYLRRKVRTQRRAGMARPGPAAFALRRAWEIARTYVPALGTALRMAWLRKRVMRQEAARLGQ